MCDAGCACAGQGVHQWAANQYRRCAQCQCFKNIGAAADAAVLAQDRAFAEMTLEQFVKLHNTDPAALTEAARIYRALGRNKEATALLRRAVAIEQSQALRVQVAQRTALGVGPNPFLGRRAQRVQSMQTVTAAVPPPADTFLDGEQAAARAAHVRQGLSLYRHDREPGLAKLSTVEMPSQANAPVDNGRLALGVTLVSLNADSVSDEASSRFGGGAASSAARPAPSPGTQYGTRSTPQAILADDGISPAQRALNDIRGSRAAHVRQGLSLRSNDSEPGLSKLSDVEMPFQADFPVGDGRIALGVTLVTLDAGRMNDEASTRFGGGAASAAGVGPQREEGVGLSIAYMKPEAGFNADIGSTPIGFEYKTAVGGISIERPLQGSAHMRYGAALSRRAVTESLTSFAGTTDLREGLSWGGVTANGGRVQLSYDDDEVGMYSYASAHRLLGHHVKSNARAELGGGVYRYLHNEPDRKATVGLSASVLGYANNQGFYTYGHGGYFSPQRYAALGIPVSWAQRSDHFTWQFKGSIGIQSFQHNGADYFPNDPIRQAASGLRYAEQSNSGFGYSLEATGEYRFGRKLFVGGAFVLDNSRDYRQYNAGMYMRYLFEDMTENPLPLPVSPYRSPYSN